MLFIDRSEMRFRYAQLIKVGIHIGHSYINSLYESGWMVYAFRKELLIINLFKFVTMLKHGFNIINHALNKKAPVWFVNLDQSFDRYTRIAAERCGEFSATLYWIKGMLSNFSQIIKSFRKLKRLSLFVKNRKNQIFEKNYSRWILTRYTWPRAIFISSIERSYFAAKEANSFQIPSLGIVDTTTDAQASSLAVPGNDDSLDCIVFYNNLICGYILYKKFVSVIIWFSNVRKSKRVISFDDWISRKIASIKISSWEFIPFNFNLKKDFQIKWYAVKFFSAKGIWLDQVRNQLYIFRQNYDKHNIVSKTIIGLDSIINKIYNIYAGYKARKGFNISRKKVLKSLWSRNKNNRRYKMQMKKDVTNVLLRFSEYSLYDAEIFSFEKNIKNIRSFFIWSQKFYYFINSVIFSFLLNKRQNALNIADFFGAFNKSKKKVFYFYLISMFNNRRLNHGIKKNYFTSKDHINKNLVKNKQLLLLGINKSYFSKANDFFLAKRKNAFNTVKKSWRNHFGDFIFSQLTPYGQITSLFDLNQTLSWMLFGLTNLRPQFMYARRRIGLFLKVRYLSKILFIINLSRNFIIWGHNKSEII